MSTVSQQQRQRASRKVYISPSLAPKRRPWRWAIVLGALVAILWFLPPIIAHTPLMSWVLRKVANLNGNISVQSASLGWFSPISASGIEICDAENQLVLHADQLTAQRSLFGLLTNLHDVGTMRIERPKLTLLLSKDGSNIETVLARWLNSESSGQKTGFSLEIVDGEFTVCDMETRKTWQLEKLQFALAMSRQSDLPTKLEATAAVKDGQRTSSLSLSFHQEPCDSRADLKSANSNTNSSALGNRTYDTLANTSGELNFQAESLPLAMFERMAARRWPQTRLTGTLASKVGLQWTSLNTIKLNADALVSGWNQPIRVAMAAHQTAQGVVVDGLQCDSQFLKINGTGTPQRFAASITMNMKPLADQLNQFVDLGGVTMAGDGWGNIQWTLSPDSTFETDGELRLRGFRLILPQCQPWIEDNLIVALAAKGNAGAARPARLDMASVQLRSPTDQIDLKLAQPIADLSAGLAGPIDVKAQGRLDGWPGRLAAFVNTQNLRLGGNYQVSGRVETTKEAFSLRDAKITAAQLAVASPWVNCAEPSAELAASLSWGRTSPTLQVQSATLTSSTVAMQARDVAITMPPVGPWQVVGAASFTSNLERLRAWFAAPGVPPAWRLAGQLVGTLQLQPSDGRIQCKTDADITNLIVTGSSGNPFQEPKVHLTAVGAYQPQDGAVRLDQLELTSGIVAAKATGQTVTVNGKNDTQLNGELTYDWDRLTTLLQPIVGPSVRISGQGKAPLSYRGPLWPPQGQAALELQWNNASAYGFQVGKTTIKSRLADGVVQTEPIQADCNSGRVSLTPRIRLSPEPMELTLPAGPALQQIQIDPMMCHAALRYVAPIVASVTTARGSFSVQLDGCRIPLSDISKGEMAGRLTVHSVEVGPGPLLQQLSMLMNSQPTMARIKRESVVTFRMVGGRMYHQGLELEFPDMVIRTYGSVGFDESLAMMTEMTVPPRWLAGTPVGEAVKNQVIHIPIAGTLNRPQIDQSEIGRISKEVLRNTTRNVLENGVQQLQNGGLQLDRLFGPPPRRN